MKLTNPKNNAEINSRFATHADAAEFLAELCKAGEFGPNGAPSADFPHSILDSAKRGKLSAAQAFWLHKLASEGRPKAQPSGTFNLAGLMTLFGKAAAKLKRPAIVLARPDNGEEVKVSVAGPGSRYTGQLMIASPEYGVAYYGRVTQTGEFFAGKDACPAVRDLLAELAEDAAACAAKHGHLTGKCCFCNRPLTDDKSTGVGYGKICSEKYGLPWGKKLCILAGQ